MPFVSDNFVVLVSVDRIPSITVPNEYKSIGPTIGGASPIVGFYYDGGAGANAGESFSLAWTSIVPTGPEPVNPDFTPNVPLEGRPTTVPTTVVPGQVVGNVFPISQTELYWWGTVRFTMPTGQTQDTRYEGEVRLNY